MQNIIEELGQRLFDSVNKHSTYGMLFSGGLDTAVLAATNKDIKAVTVNFQGEGEDIYYSNLVAKFFNIKHFHKSVDVDEAIEAIPEVIRILKSFDPALCNDLTVYFGIKAAKELGVKSIMTGDGSDELFAGYSFMQRVDNLSAYIQRISKTMRFSSNDIGKFFGVKIIQPFISRDMIKFALRIPIGLKIRRENSKIYGKWILRKAFEDILPKEAVWQSKRPLEYGSGMTRIREIISLKVCDKEFKEAKKSSPIKFWDKEHYYYYRIYKDVIGDIPKARDKEKECPCCKAGMDPDASHCKVCGCVLDQRGLDAKNKVGWSIMSSQKVKAKSQKGKITKAVPNAKVTSYRLKCPKTANGLSHFVMYGDIKEEKTLL